MDLLARLRFWPLLLLLHSARASRDLLSPRTPQAPAAASNGSSSPRSLRGTGRFQERTLVLNHLAKSGGSFIQEVLRKALPRKVLRVEPESASVSWKDINRQHFIIGQVRNPFNYYVSLWAFTSQRRTCCFKRAISRTQRRELLGKQKPYGSTEDDRARFKKWLRTVSSHTLGVASLRFYGSYLLAWDRLANGKRGLPKDWQHLGSSHDRVQRAAEEVNAAFRNFSLAKGPVSCWVKTESLVGGLQQCLIQYETEVGRPRVNWQAFNRTLRLGKRNIAPHAPCEDFYDDDTRALVLQGDRHLLQAFGYPRECSRQLPKPQPIP